MLAVLSLELHLDGCERVLVGKINKGGIFFHITQDFQNLPAELWPRARRGIEKCKTCNKMHPVKMIEVNNRGMEQGTQLVKEIWK